MALVLTNTRVESNVASLTGGGAHVTTGATLTLNGGEISANTAANGAGLACVGGEHGGGEIIGSGIVVRENVASGLGGGVYLTKACGATFTDTSVIDGNRAVSGSSCRALYAVGGGGVRSNEHAGAPTTPPSRAPPPFATTPPRAVAPFSSSPRRPTPRPTHRAARKSPRRRRRSTTTPRWDANRQSPDEAARCSSPPVTTRSPEPRSKRTPRPPTVAPCTSPASARSP